METRLPPPSTLADLPVTRSLAEPRYRTYTLLLAVLLQCGLYGINLNLLPMWGDEAFTLVTVTQTPAQIIATVRDDIHPPLYFLLAHWWIHLPFGSNTLLQLRALSVIFVILTTVFVDRRWLRAAPRNLRNWFLLFWAASPCLLLLGRMARSYSLQMLLAAIAMWCALEFTENPVSWEKTAALIGSLAALLYTHYLAGIAVWAGANLLILLRRSRSNRSINKVWLFSNVLVVLLYLPWLITLAGALRQWEHHQVHSLTASIWTEQVVKVAYCFYSFTFGESIPFWLLPLTLLLALPCLWLLISGARSRTEWLWPGIFAAAVAYLGATRWVTAPFMGARLLFLLPLFLLALASGVTAKGRVGFTFGVVLIATNLVGIRAYFQANDILNLAYLTPYQRIAEQIERHSRAGDTVVWVDGLNFDEETLVYYLPKNLRIRELSSRESVEAARKELHSSVINHVWFVRSVHDISAGHAFEQAESQMMESWAKHAVTYYLELSPTHRAILRALALLRRHESQPRQYMYEVSEFRRPE